MAIAIFEGEYIFFSSEAGGSLIFVLTWVSWIALIDIFFGEGENCGFADTDDAIKLFLGFFATEAKRVFFLWKNVLSFCLFDQLFAFIILLDSDLPWEVNLLFFDVAPPLLYAYLRHLLQLFIILLFILFYLTHYSWLNWMFWGKVSRCGMLKEKPWPRVFSV